jgi:hypothetical protein
MPSRTAGAFGRFLKQIAFHLGSGARMAGGIGGGRKLWSESIRYSHLVRARLVILRLTPAAAARAAKAQYRRQNRCRSHRPLQPLTVQATGYLMLVTSLPAEVPAVDVLEAYRLRWQVELAFKRLKSLVGIGRLPIRSEALARSWLFAHLIMALLIEDASTKLLVSHFQQPATASCATSLWRITQVLRHTLLAAIRGLSNLAALLSAAGVLGHRLRERCRQRCSQFDAARSHAHA